MQVVNVSPAEVERRMDDIFAAAIDRGLDAVAKHELAELQQAVRHNAKFMVGQLLELNRRVAELEATTVRIEPELVLAEPVDGVAFEDAAHEPIAITRQRHFGTHLRLIKENDS